MSNVPAVSSHQSRSVRELHVLQALLAEMRDKAHILTPFCRTAIPKIPDKYLVYIHQYTVSLETEMVNGKEVFTDGEVYRIPDNGRLALTKFGLWRLEQLAGVSWENPDTGAPTLVRTDQKNDPLVCQYSATGYLRDIDGKVRKESDGFGYDLREGSPQAKALVNNPKMLARLRSNIEQQTITKAKLRTLRALLGIRDSYKPEELRKPFIVFRLMVDLDALPADVKDDLITMAAAQQMGVEKELGYLPKRRLAADAAGAAQQLPPASEPQKLSAAQPVPALPPAARQAEPIIHEAEVVTEKDSRIERIAQLYLSKKGKTRAQLSPDKPPLTDLTDSELSAIENALSALPNLQ